MYFLPNNKHEEISTIGSIFFFLESTHMYGRFESMFESIYCVLDPAIVSRSPGTNGLNGAHET